MLASSKLPNVEASIFTIISKLAAEHNAINLAQGFPEFDMPKALKQATSEAIEKGINQYAPSMGMPQLLENIAAMTHHFYGAALNPLENITVTSGAAEALFVAIQAMVRPGDEVILFDPAFDLYQPAIELAGGQCKHISLSSPHYAINWQEVEDTVNQRTRLIIINSPHNPTGTILSYEDMLQLQRIILDNDLYLISDEVYEHIIFDDVLHQSILRFPDLFERSFVVSSFGKTFHCTGWRLGYCCAPSYLTTELRKIHQYTTFASFTPAQVGVAYMLSEQLSFIQNLSGFYQQKREACVQAFANSPLKLLPSYGTYFILADYRNMSDLNDWDFCHWLMKEKGVATIPLSRLRSIPCDEKIVRLCFAKNTDTLKQAAANLT